MDVIADFSGYPQWALAVKRAEVIIPGSYVLEPVGEATKVTYSLTVDLAIPVIKMIKRRAEKVIMDTALKELKRQVELLT